MLRHYQLKDKIDPWVYSQLYTHCPYCGAEILTSENLARRTCSNPDCIRKNAYKAEQLLKALKASGIGVETCYTILKEHNMKNHFEILDINKYKFKPTRVKETYIYDFAKRKYRMSLHNVVTNAFIPGIGKEKAFELVSGKKDVNEIVGITNETKEFLKYAASLFNLQELNTSVPFYIMLTNSINGYTNRNDFIEYLNDNYGDMFYFVECGKVLRADVLITDNLTGTSKEVFARKNSIAINSSKNFLDIVKGMYAERGDKR